jgi:hypothetical protein
MAPEMKTQLYGDENAGHIQDIIDSRTQADKNLKQAQDQAKEQQRNTIEAAARIRQQQANVQGEAGTKLSQEASNATRRASEAAQTVRDAAKIKAAADVKVKQNQANSFANIQNWKIPGLGALGGLGGASLIGEGLGTMAHNALSGVPISDIPDIGLYPALGIAGALGASGAKQMWRYPGQTSRNMLLGTLPATSTEHQTKQK